jgi:predicted DNA-binding antitoxin AbrB/MazE fold protein
VAALKAGDVRALRADPLVLAYQAGIRTTRSKAMNKQVEAVYENGLFRPLSRVNLPEGERVRLTVMTLGEKIIDPAYNLAEIAEETGIPDLATNIDHYLYGLPKQSDE